jgi:NAD(P)-dependent dehydrogenase (short-subunit alcohol dehydrogenase family)
MSKYIIVGTSGIGASLAHQLAKQGHALHLIARDPLKLRHLASELGATWSVADVVEPLALEAAILEAGNDVAALAYTVGTINLGPVHRTVESDILRDFVVNSLGAFRAVKAALPALKSSSEKTASVVLFSTVAVAQGFSSHASVSMAKGAIEGLTRTLAAELAPKIRVNAIAPSLTKTPLAAPMTSNENMASAIAAMHPLQRLGEPEDVASLAAFLMTSQSGWITGQVIGVDGGRSTLRTKG